jgi:hypothetical protein
MSLYEGAQVGEGIQTGVHIAPAHTREELLNL